MTPRLPTTKKEKIIHLLDHWDDIHTPPSPNTGGTSGSSTPHLSPMSKHPSVLELTRCLTQLKTENKLWHDHLKAHHNAEWRIHTRRSTRKRKNGKTEQIVHRDRVRKPPTWVKHGYVTAGHHRLEQLFNGTVSIPEPLYQALTLSSTEIAELERKHRRQPVDTIHAPHNIRRPRTRPLAA